MRVEAKRSTPAFFYPPPAWLERPLSPACATKVIPHGFGRAYELPSLPNSFLKPVYDCRRLCGDPRISWGKYSCSQRASGEFIRRIAPPAGSSLQLATT